MIISFNKSLLSACAFLLSVTCISPVLASTNSGMTKSQGDRLIEKLNSTLVVLQKWADDNTAKANRLETYFTKENSREQNNFEVINKEAWNDVKQLNQDSMLLLEASYAFAKKNESAAEFSAQSIKSNAWNECLQMDSCNFKKLNELIDEKSLELSEFTKQNAMDTQKALIDSIEKLNDFSSQSKDSIGLNDSIDNLSKINTTQATALASLSNQVSNLTKLQASEIQYEQEQKKIEKRADEMFFSSQNRSTPKHLSLQLSDYD